MNDQEFKASAGYYLANGGIDHNVASAEQICAHEKTRLRVINEPEIARLGCYRETLLRERRELQAIPGARPSTSVT
jgi:hypothetical protein